MSADGLVILEEEMMDGIDNRKDVLLLLLFAPGSNGEDSEPIIGRTRLMKLLYLANHEYDIADLLGLSDKWYRFEPYHYGPFSKDVFDDVDFLKNVDLIETRDNGPQSIPGLWEEERASEEAAEDIEDGFVKINMYEEESHQLTEKGKAFVFEKLLSHMDDDVWNKIRTLKQKEGSLSLSTLLRYVYSKFPESAKESTLHHLKT